ncbi:MAG: NAD-dependent epimerase/dehydratase family protein [Actinomycetota bacterium]|nr:NAD-dependent epimerase/dehydratase family protein [Actinomycetota bacterium]
MKCLVTGAAGFIGSRLCARLVEDGHDVVGLDNLSDGSMTNLEGVEDVEFHESDLRDEDAMMRAASGCEVIFHQAAMRSVPRSMEMPALTSDVNVRGTLNVLLAAHRNSARVVAASSSSVYGEQDTYPLHEGLRPSPQSPYAASKLAGEVYCQTWTKAFGVPTISLRYFNVYGPAQDPSSEYATVMPKFVLACLTGERPMIHGNGEQARDFTYIDDAVEANLLAARAPDDAAGLVLNVGGGRQPTSVNQLLAIIAELTDTQPEPVFGDPRPGDVWLTHADVSLAESSIGYRPAVDITEGLRRSVEWFTERYARTT